MHTCFRLFRCSNCYPIQMHPHFPHFWPQRKASALHELKTILPTKASRARFEFYFSKFKRTLSFSVALHFSAHPPNWPYFCPQREHEIFLVNSTFAAWFARINGIFISFYDVSMQWHVAHCTPVPTSQLSSPFGGPKLSPQNALTIHHRDSFIDAQKSNIQQWDMMQEPADVCNYNPQSIKHVKTLKWWKK